MHHANVKEEVDPARSRLMSRVGPKDTKPEMIVRRLLHAAGYRYRLHVKSLPGSPDLVFPSRRAVIMVHGCFWHRHEGCRKATTPKTRVEFWKNKFTANQARDERQLAELRELGWRTLVVWECWTEAPNELERRLVDFLGEPGGAV
ncbi:MAG: very short patch repair endonuclease [Paracoccaceae bacterium]